MKKRHVQMYNKQYFSTQKVYIMTINAAVPSFDTDEYHHRRFLLDNL